MMPAPEERVKFLHFITYCPIERVEPLLTTKSILPVMELIADTKFCVPDLLNVKVHTPLAETNMVAPTFVQSPPTLTLASPPVPPIVNVPPVCDQFPATLIVVILLPFIRFIIPPD